MTALNNQQVGDPLLLECNVTTVRGITSSVDIVWSTNDTEIGGAEDVSGEVLGNTVVYRNIINGSTSGLILSEGDNGISYKCHLREFKAITVDDIFKLSKLFAQWDLKNQSKITFNVR